MKILRVTLFSFFVVLFSASGGLGEEKKTVKIPHDYTIGAGDVLEISVWKDEALTRAVSVLPDGKIAFPLVGQVDVKGKTLKIVQKEISRKLSKYIPSPEVNVSVRQVNSMNVFVIGKVNRPGSFSLIEDYNVMQVLALAGGLNAYAKKNKIKIFRKVDGKTYVVRFRYGDVSKGKNLETNIPLRRGDVVVVP